MIPRRLPAPHPPLIPPRRTARSITESQSAMARVCRRSPPAEQGSSLTCPAPLTPTHSPALALTFVQQECYGASLHETDPHARALALGLPALREEGFWTLRRLSSAILEDEALFPEFSGDALAERPAPL
jgi:hypothetical protein